MQKNRMFFSQHTKGVWTSKLSWSLRMTFSSCGSSWKKWVECLLSSAVSPLFQLRGPRKLKDQHDMDSRLCFAGHSDDDLDLFLDDALPQLDDALGRYDWLSWPRQEQGRTWCLGWQVKSLQRYLFGMRVPCILMYVIVYLYIYNSFYLF